MTTTEKRNIKAIDAQLNRLRAFRKNFQKTQEFGLGLTYLFFSLRSKKGVDLFQQMWSTRFKIVFVHASKRNLVVQNFIKKANRFFQSS